MSNYMKFNV